MSVLEEVLEEEYDRSVRMSRRIEAELAVLPKGSVRKREIHGHVYYYLNYREGDKVKSKYIPAADVAYEEPSKFPGMDMDLSLLLPEGMKKFITMTTSIIPMAVSTGGRPDRREARAWTMV